MIIKLHYEACYNCYKIIRASREGVSKLFEARGFNNSIDSSYFELLGAELFDGYKAGGQGPDITGTPSKEIKSVQIGNEFKWDFHTQTGLQKIQTAHLWEYGFFSYKGMELLEVRVGEGELLKDKFEEMEKKYLRVVPRTSRIQYAITYKLIKERIPLVMTIDESGYTSSK